MRRPPFALAAAAALSLIAAGPATAQHEVGAAFVIDDPRGAFDENTDTGYGFGVTYLYALAPSRAVAVGATGSFLNYGRTRREAPLSPTIPDIRVDVETANNIGFLQGVLQLKAPIGPVQPYVLGTGGFGWFSTSTTLENRRTHDRLLSDTNKSDATWAYGGGGGLQLRVYTGPPREERPPVRAFLDLGGRWLRGGDVEYLTEGSLVTDEGEFDLDPRLVRSEVELVEYRIGLTVEF